MKDSVSALMRVWPGLELSIILPGRSNVEEMTTFYDWKDGNEVGNCISFSLCKQNAHAHRGAKSIRRGLITALHFSFTPQKQNSPPD